MALSIESSQKEAERVGAIAYQGKVLSVMLCYSNAMEYDETNLISDWQSLEIEGDGYVRFTITLGAGSWSEVDSRYESSPVTASFTCTGGPSHSYDKVIAYFEGESYPSAIITEDPNVLIRLNQIKQYQFQFTFY